MKNKKTRDNKYQLALNDVIQNAGTDFKCKNDSFYLLQELVYYYSFEIINKELEE